MTVELVSFTDETMVVVGEHLSLEETRVKFQNECDDDIISVKHWWVRYEFIGEPNCPDDWDDPSPGDALWMLKETEIRPKGCVRKATVINA
jgi:hypothetical protein